MVPLILPYIFPSTLGRYLQDHDGKASWALITGASDGIGFGFAQELASHGFNLIIHGRNREKLSKVQTAILYSYPNVEIVTVTADAASFDSSDIDRIMKVVSDIPVTILINNVGGAGPMKAQFETFAKHTTTEITSLISLNITFTTLLTHAVLPVLSQHQPALIMNIGSAAMRGTPFLPVYSATKGYVATFTTSLGIETKYSGLDIEVLGILVASTQSQQNQSDKPTFFVPAAREMARASLERVGCGERVVFGYWPHALQYFGLDLLPTGVLEWALVKALTPLVGKEERRFT